MKKIKEISVYIPPVIFEEIIFPRLPLKAISRFRCVSKSWNTQLSDPSIRRKHYQLIQENNNENNLKTMVFNGSNLYSLEFETYGGNSKVVEMNHTFDIDEYATRIMGSYNGLICISRADFGDFYVWNPSTGVSKLLPMSKDPEGEEEWEYFTCGYGYNEIEQEFQLVNIWSTDRDNVPSYVQLYSSRKNKWEILEPIDYRVPEYGGKLVNGVLHWPAQHISSSGMYEDVVVAYNINGREFNEVQLPMVSSRIICSVGVLLGYLCVFCSKQSDLTYLEAWIMEDYGIENSWARLLKISPSPCTSWVRMVPLRFMDNFTEILISDQSGFFVYDFEDQDERLEEYVIENLPEGIYESIAYKDNN